MEIDQQTSLGGLAGHAMIELDHPLIVSLHEVDLDARNAQSLEAVERFVHVFVEGAPQHPEDDADSLFLAVTQNLWEIDVRIFVKDVHRRRSPAFVEEDVFDAMFGGEVDKVFVCRCVDARAEIDSRDVDSVPPIPGNFARFDPGSVVNDRRRRELVDKF
jgi:hypothetical protein